jgi:hypothetical protein
VVYYENYQDVRVAIALEKQLAGPGRKLGTGNAISEAEPGQNSLNLYGEGDILEMSPLLLSRTFPSESVETTQLRCGRADPSSFAFRG